MYSQFDARVELTRFEKSVRKYEESEIQEGKILFWGSSLFTRWSKEYDNTPLEEMIRGKDGSAVAVNHGIGGATAEELLFYYPRMVQPWKPRALVLATEANDAGFGYSAQDVMEIQARIIQWAKADFPDIRIYCFNGEPTLKSKGQVTVGTRMRKEYNELLEAFCAVTENCIYVPMEKQAMFFENPEDIGDYDKIREDIFHEDQVHLDPVGYGLFMDFVRELLDDLL
jgi:lysophospholipase L1-like esterase